MYFTKFCKILSSDIFQKISLAIALKVSSAALVFLLSIVLANYLGAKGSGNFFLTLSIILIAIVVSKFGLDILLLRRISSLAETNRWLKISLVYKTHVVLGVLNSIIVSVIIYLSAEWLANDLFKKPEIGSQLQIMSLCIVPSVVYLINSEALKSLKNISKSILIQNILVPFIVISTTLILAYYNAASVLTTNLGYLLATSLTAVLSIYYWNKTINLCDNNIIEKRLPKKYYLLNFKTLNKSKPFFYIAASNLLIQYSSILVIGVYQSSSDVGIYSAALRTAGLISFVLIALNTVIAPKMSAYFFTGDYKNLSKVSKLSSILGLLSAFPITLIYFLFSKQILGIFGDEFITGSDSLLILAFGHFANVSTGSVLFLLMMTGHEKVVSRLTMFFAVINIVLNITLVKFYGIVGAAIATALTMFFINTIAFFYAKNHIGISTVPFIRSKVLQ